MNTSLQLATAAVTEELRVEPRSLLLSDGLVWFWIGFQTISRVSRSLLLSDALVFAYIYKGQCVSGARGSSFSSRGASPGRRWPFGQGSSIKRTGE